VTEVQGMEGETILLQDVFKYRVNHVAEHERGKPTGELVPTGLRPRFMDKLAEKEIDVPASAFRPPAPAARPDASLPHRRVHVPDAAELVQRERLR
jgi:hypothetical protein